VPRASRGVGRPVNPSAGRPEIGPPINVRLGDNLLQEVSAYAEAEGISRAEAIRQLVQNGLRRERSRAVPPWVPVMVNLSHGKPAWGVRRKRGGEYLRAGNDLVVYDAKSAAQARANELNAG
jgi:hypothetical protein